MNTRLVNYRFLLCAVVFCGLLTSLTFTRSETNAFNRKRIGNLATAGLTYADSGSVPQNGERTIVPPAKVQILGCCDRAGQVVSLDVSTGVSGSSLDYYWSVNGHSANIVTGVLAGNWTALPPAKWLQPFNSANAYSDGSVGVVYKYAFTFNVAKCAIPTVAYRLTGKFAADNSASVWLDHNQISPGCTGSNCFSPANILNLNLTLLPGSHTLEFDVKNDEGYTGLLVNAQIKRVCARQT